jgi:methylated-DNA-[protein]-cysteine S-methyltransferase
MIYDIYETSVAGTLVLAGDGERLRHLSFVNGRHPLHIEDDWRRDPAPFAGIKAQLADYFNGRRQAFDIALDPVGTPFQMRVWAALREIPYGRAVSYQWVAQRIGAPTAVRAVGAANGRNPIAIIIPCHRVIGKHGGLTGYGGGLDLKHRLLQLENPQAGLPLDPA